MKTTFMKSTASIDIIMPHIASLRYAPFGALFAITIPTIPNKPPYGMKVLATSATTHTISAALGPRLSHCLPWLCISSTPLLRIVEYRYGCNGIAARFDQEHCYVDAACLCICGSTSFQDVRYRLFRSEM